MQCRGPKRNEGNWKMWTYIIENEEAKHMPCLQYDILEKLMSFAIGYSVEMCCSSKMGK